MTAILIFYLISTVMFIFGIDELDRPNKQTVMYLGLAFLSGTMGYFLSYSDTDYTLAAYYPLVLTIISSLLLIYVAWQYLRPKSWGESADAD